MRGIRFATLPGKTVYHDSCHLLRGLGENQTPRQCLDHGSGETAKSCPTVIAVVGSVDRFAVKFPEVSCAMLEDKIKSAEEVDATWLVAADAGCMLNIAGGLSRRKSTNQTPPSLHKPWLRTDTIRAGPRGINFELRPFNRARKFRIESIPPSCRMLFKRLQANSPTSAHMHSNRLRHRSP